MKKTNILKLGLFVGMLGISTLSFADNTYTATGFAGTNKIGVLNNTADPEIQLKGQSDIVNLGNDNTAENLGLGLLRSIYGEYTNVLCSRSGDDTCLDGSQISSQIGKGNASSHIKKVANIFPRQLELSQMLANALMMFSTAVLMLQTLIFMLMFVVFLGKGTGKNTSIEENYHIGVGTILRVLLSVVLVFPTTTGYSIGLIAALQSNSISTRFGDLIWAAALKTISPEQLEYKTKAAIYEQLTGFKNFQSLNDTIADAAYCSVFMNNSLEGNIKTVDGKSSSSINGDATNLGTSFWGSSEFVFGAKTVITDGEIRINFGPRDSIGNLRDKWDVNKRRALFRTYRTTSNQQLSPEEQAYFNALAESDNNVPANYCGRITLPVSLDLKEEGGKLKDLSDKTRAKNSVAYAEAQSILILYNEWFNFFNDKKKFDFTKTRSGIYYKKDGGSENQITELNMMKKQMEYKYYNLIHSMLSGVNVRKLADNNAAFIFNEPSNLGKEDFNKGFGLTSGGMQIAYNPELNYAKNLIGIFIAANNGASRETMKVNFENAVNQLYLDYTKHSIRDVNGVLDNNSKVKEYASLQAKMFHDATRYGWISAGSWFSTLSGISTNFDFIDVPTPIITIPEYINTAFSTEKVNLQVGDQDLQGIDRTVVKKFKRYYYPYGYSVNNTGAIRLYNATSSTSGASENLASQQANNFGINVSQWLGYDPNKKSNDQFVHPLLQLQSSGNNMMRIGEGIIGFTQVMDVIQSGHNTGFNNEMVEATTRQITGNNPALLSVDSILSQVISKSVKIATIMGYILYFGGAMLAIYLPLLPTIYWVSGVLTWAIGSFVNLIAINIMAIGITLSKGEEVLGRAQIGAFMLLENGLRPVLQPIGGIAFIIFSGLFIPLSSFLMNDAYARLATQSTMMTGGIIYVMISIGMQYWITIQCVQLINGLHQKAMGHINAQMTVDDQSERQAQHLGGIIQQGRAESRMLGSSGGGATAGLRSNPMSSNGGGAVGGLR